MLLTWKHKTKQQQQQVGFYSSRICGQNMLVLPRIFRFSGIDLFMVFSTFDMDKLGKIRRHHWKSVLKLIKLLSLKLICWKLMKKQLLKVLKIYRLLYGGGTNLHPAIQTSVNFRNFVELYLCSLKMLSLSNLAIIWATAEYPATLYHHCFRWSAFFEERSITQ